MKATPLPEHPPCAMHFCCTNGRPAEPCDWKATVVIAEVALCWVHASAVQAGTRELPIERARRPA